MKTSEREKRKLVAEWRMLEKDWREEGRGMRPISKAKNAEPERTKEQRTAMADCIHDCANELEAMLEGLTAEEVENPESKPFEKGDVVTLRSGGERMTVLRVAGNIVHVVLMRKGRPVQAETVDHTLRHA